MRIAVRFKHLLCEQPKVIGLDLSAAVVRDETRHREVRVQLDNRAVEIALEFEDCGPPTYFQRTGSSNAASFPGRSKQ